MAQRLNPLHLPVRTESGRALGQIVDIVIEPDTQSIVAYHVKPNRLLPDIVVSPLIINRSQVISIGPEAMIVDDATVQVPQGSTAPPALA